MAEKSNINTAAARRAVVESLIDWHFEIEPDLEMVFWLNGEGAAKDAPIQLLEVNAATIPSETIEAFAFSPAGDVPFQVVVAEITPQELKQLSETPERLPSGWDLQKAERYARAFEDYSEAASA